VIELTIKVSDDIYDELLLFGDIDPRRGLPGISVSISQAIQMHPWLGAVLDRLKQAAREELPRVESRMMWDSLFADCGEEDLMAGVPKGDPEYHYILWTRLRERSLELRKALSSRMGDGQ